MEGTPRDYVDTGMWVGETVEESRNCREYINSIPLKHKNNGIIGHFVLSELTTEAITGVSYEEEIEGLDRTAQELFLNAVMSAISSLWKKDYLRIVKLQDAKIDCDLIEELQRVERNLTYDDALHLCVAISQGCGRFVTTDNLFNADSEKGSQRLISHLDKKHGLKVKHVKK